MTQDTHDFLITAILTTLVVTGFAWQRGRFNRLEEKLDSISDEMIRFRKRR
jgi:hypothetical protein